MIDKKKMLLPLSALLIIPFMGVGLIGTANAATTPGAMVAHHTMQWGKGGQLRGGKGFGGVFGTVTAVNGSTITLTGKNNTTYTVDASTATISKAPTSIGTQPTTITIANIAIGDTLMVQGTVSGTAVAAKNIMDGKMPIPPKPAAVGTVTAINGSVITLTGGGKNNITYTIDASNATITKMAAPTAGQRPTTTTITLSGIAVGDTLMVQGTATGTSVVATSINDSHFMGKGGFGRTNGLGKLGVGGTVTAVNGSTITLAGKNNTTYTVDASSATIKKISAATVAGTKPTIADITVAQVASGDTLMIEGTVNGTAVTAKTIFDGTMPQRGPRPQHFGTQTAR